MICNGKHSCYEATIRNASNVLVNGDDALYFTTIVSELNGRDTFNMKINGTNQYASYLYCNATD